MKVRDRRTYDEKGLSEVNVKGELARHGCEMGASDGTTFR